MVQRLLDYLRGAPGECFAVVVLLAIQAVLLAYSATRHSPTHLEPPFLAAGVSHWELGRFELYRVNPPLPRMIAALPVLAVGCKTDWSGFITSPSSRSEYKVGTDFVKANGERTQYLIVLARWACIPFALLGGFFAYRWGQELYGGRAGLLALFLYVFEPNLLAHSELVTPDAACISFGLMSGYLFWRWLRQPDWSRTVLAGLALGLAVMAKFTWLLLFGLWPLIALFYFFRVPSSVSRKSCDTADAESCHGLAAPLHSVRRNVDLMLKMLAIAAIALCTINTFYVFDGVGKPLEDYTFNSKLFAGSDGGELAGNRFRHSWLGKTPMPFPEQFLLGIDLQQKDFESINIPSYFRGAWSDRGFFWYYLYGLLVKVPLPIWAIFAFVCIQRAIDLLRPRSSAALTSYSWRDELPLLIPSAALLLTASLQTAYSHHFRYVFASLALILIFLGSALAANSRRGQQVFSISALCLTVIGTLWIYPHQLSYFNELVSTGNANYRPLLGSSCDWGQNLAELERFRVSHPEKPLKLVTTPLSAANSLLSKDISIDVPPFQSTHVIDWFDSLPDCFVAIDISVFRSDGRLQTTLMTSVGGSKNTPPFEQIRDIPPDYWIGNTLLIYDRDSLRQELGASVVIESTTISQLRSRPLLFTKRPTASSPERVHALEQAASLLQSKNKRVAASNSLHLLTALQSNCGTADDCTLRTSLLNSFLDVRHGENQFGSPPFTETRFGLRPNLASRSSAESHDGQSLAVFAQLDLSMDTTISGDFQKEHSIRSLMADLIASFSRDQREVEFAASAFAAYLPPFRQWRNKWGHVSSFDDLCDELLTRDLSKSSCCGCHVLESLIAIRQIHRDYAPILSDEVFRRVDDRVNELTARALAAQCPDGSWTAKWHNERSQTTIADVPLDERLLATSHLLHVLLNVPQDAIAAREAAERARAWLKRTVDMISGDDNFIVANLCPYTHAFQAMGEMGAGLKEERGSP